MIAATWVVVCDAPTGVFVGCDGGQRTTMKQYGVRLGGGGSSSTSMWGFSNVLMAAGGTCYSSRLRLTAVEL